MWMLFVKLMSPAPWWLEPAERAQSGFLPPSDRPRRTRTQLNASLPESRLTSVHIDELGAHDRR
jgi:hypothetical protein